MTEFWAVGLVLVAGFLGGLGALLFKMSADQFTLTLEGTLKNKWLILGCLCYGLSVVLFVPALRGGEVSVLYPIAASSYVWLSLLSVHFLKEKMNILKWISIILIIAGIALLGGS